MAQLPPRIPSIAAGNWAVNFERSPAMSAPQQPSWVDEFLCFSAARRGAHRRSVSDSVAFLEAPLADCPAAAVVAGEFDRLDDDQLMSMFSDDVPPPAPVVSSSNPSTPSDHNSINEDQKTTAAAERKAEEAESEEEQPAPGPEPTTFVDSKRVKRYTLRYGLI